MKLKLTISKRTIRSIVLIFCAVLMENLFYLLDIEKHLFWGIHIYNYIWLIVLVIFVGYTYFKHRQWESKVTYHFGRVIAFMVGLVFIQALRGHIVTGQTFLEGIIGQGCFLIIILSYYPIRKFYASKIIDDKTVDRCLIAFGIVAFTIYAIQVLFGQQHTFLYVQMNERYESLRLYVDSVLCVLLGFYGMNRFIRTKKWTSIILVALTVVYELFISKGRLEFAAFCASMAIGLILMKKHKAKKLLAIVIGFCLVVAFLNNPYINVKVVEVIDNFLNGTGTMKGREYGRELYAAQLLSSIGSLVFGRGYPNTEQANNMAGHDKNIFLVDNGIFAFAFVYGCLGLIAIILWFGKMLKMAWKLYRKQNEYIYLMFIIFNIFLMYNIIFWWWKFAWTLIMVIMMCKMEHHLFDLKEKEPIYEGPKCTDLLTNCDLEYSGGTAR